MLLLWFDDEKLNLSEKLIQHFTISCQRAGKMDMLKSEKPLNSLGKSTSERSFPLWVCAWKFTLTFRLTVPQPSIVSIQKIDKHQNIKLKASKRKLNWKSGIFLMKYPKISRSASRHVWWKRKFTKFKKYIFYIVMWFDIALHVAARVEEQAEALKKSTEQIP